MIDPTVELTEQDERDWRTERHKDIAAICWEKCERCNGDGFHKEYWPADDSGPDYILRPGCPCCDGQGTIQLHDPLRVGALYDAADDARERMGVKCYTRIASALSLAIRGAVSLSHQIDEVIPLTILTTVMSETVPDKVYVITYPEGCDCYDAHYRAMKSCKHQIAVWLVNIAEKKMAADTQFIREEKGYE